MKRSEKALRYIWTNKHLYLMLLPVIVYYLVFKYYPMYGSIIAFKEFKLAKGIFNSPWVGFKYFEKLMKSKEFIQVFKNTLLISIMNLCFSFPVPIITSLMINEVKNNKMKRMIQTIIYVPYFITWSVMGGIVNLFLSPTIGLPAKVSNLLGIAPQNTIYIMGNEGLWLLVYIFTEIWKNAGWGTIIYMSAITSINPELYESAKLDGANKLKQIIYITLPQITPLITSMFILKLGKIASVGFEQAYALQNNMVLSIAEVISTYEYKIGLAQNIQYSYSTAIGLFKGVIGLVMLAVGNIVIKRISKGENGV